MRASSVRHWRGLFGPVQWYAERNARHSSLIRRYGRSGERWLIQVEAVSTQKSSGKGVRTLPLHSKRRKMVLRRSHDGFRRVQNRNSTQFSLDRYMNIPRKSQTSARFSHDIRTIPTTIHQDFDPIFDQDFRDFHPKIRSSLLDFSSVV